MTSKTLETEIVEHLFISYKKLSKRKIDFGL